MVARRIDNKDDQLARILAGDAAAPVGSRRKFLPAFRAEIQAAYDGLSALNSAIPVTEGGRRAASIRYQEALEKGREWVRSVHKRIGGLPPTVEKAPVFAAYGFVAGKVGRLDDPDVKNKLMAFPVASASQSGEAKLPADWLAACAALVQTIEDNESAAGIGTRSDKVKERQRLVETADDLISRVSGFLTYALPLRDFDPLMHDYGFTPRQKATRKAAVVPPSA